MSITDSLITLVREKQWSDVDLERTALLVLDALATAYAGANTPVGKKLIQWASAEPATTRSRAFLLGCLTHITETDDLHRASVSHPGCIVVPAVLALSHRYECSDRDSLLAVLKGMEAMCRIGNSVGPQHYKVWHNTATCGPFGAAFAASEIMGLDHQQTLHALGNAGTQASGLWEFLESGAMSKHLHAGRASEAGLLAAELALVDFTGPPKILEGDKGFYAGLCPDPDPAQVLANPADPWQVQSTSIKPWPSCRHTHPVIDAALEIHQLLGNRVIENIEVNTYQAAIDVCDRVEADNEYQAKFSLQHCAAKALTDGVVTLDSFDEQARREVSDMRKRVTVASNNPFAENYPEAWGARVTVTTSNGETVIAERTHCKGDPELPLNTEEMTAKAKLLLSFGGLSGSRAESVCDQVLSLPVSNGHQCSQLGSDFLSAIAV